MNLREWVNGIRWLEAPRLTAHVSGFDPTRVQNLEGCRRNFICDVIKAVVKTDQRQAHDTMKYGYGPEMSEHHGCWKNHRGRVGAVLSHDVFGNVATSRLEECIILFMEKSMSRDDKKIRWRAYTADVAARDYTRTADESGTDIRYNRAVQIRHDHNVELLRFCNKLHGGIVHDHIVELDARWPVFLRNTTESVEEKAITELHDVCLVDARHFLNDVSTNVLTVMSLELRTLRPFLRAKSKAKREMRSALARVDTFKDSTTPG
jgi:hypothetical protein